MKKLLSTIMALVMLLSLVPMAVAEEGAGTENGAVQSNNVYEVSEAAQLIWAAKNHTGDTIKLKGNVTLSEPVKITKSVVLDLGDYTVTYGGEGDLRAIYVENGADVQIKATANGGVVATTIALQVNPGGKLTVDGGTYNATYAVAVFSNETKTEAVLNSGTYDGFVYTNGTNKNSHVTFNGGTYNEMIYLAAGGQSSYEITDGLFNAALEIDAGQLDILGGTFKSSVDTTNNVNKPATNNNGSGAYQGIIVVCKPDGSSKTGYIGDAVVNIKGGTFENTFANGETIVVADFGKDEKGAGDAKVTISGDAVVKGKIALYSSENNDGVSLAISGGAFTDLASAVKYATNDATITLAGDAKGDIVIPAGKTITLDLGGHKLTNVKEHTIVNNGTLTITGTGTVDNVTHGKAALVNYGTATLNGGNFTRSKENAENNKDNGGGNSYYTILNDKGATMTINKGVTVSNVGHFSSMIRNGGDDNAVSKMTINGGTFSGGINTVKNDANGDLTINGGDFSNTSQFVIMNWNKATISDGTFEANASAGAVLYTSKWPGDSTVGDLKIEGGMYVCAKNQKLIVDCYNNDDQYLGTAVISAGAFNVAPDAKYLAEGMIVVPGVKDAPYSVQPAKREDENIKSEVKVDGDNVTVTVTDKTTGTTTETVTDTKTGAETVTKTETKVEGNVTTKTETVTEKNAADETTKVTESKIVENTENGKTETKTTVDGKTVKTDVTVNQAPATASDVTLNAKALEGKAAGTETSSVTVDKASLSELKNNTVKGVIIETDQATLKLDKTAVKTMESKVEDNDKMTLDITVTEEKNATTTEIEKVKVEVNAKNEAGQNVFPKDTENTNGLINITIPYTGNAKYLDLWYIAANESATYMGRFPVVNGFVSFDVKHFSRYDLLPVASSGSSVIKTGAGSSAASTTQTVTTDLTPGSITKVTVDGKVVDAKYYTVSGSNVTFTAEFLKTLKNGSHTVTVENATKIAKGVFTVNNPTTAQSPTTADAGIALYAGMAIASVMGTGVVFTSRKRKNH